MRTEPLVAQRRLEALTELSINDALCLIDQLDDDSRMLLGRVRVL
jgi:hypothetical protein